jgi:transposase, IS6 family
MGAEIRARNREAAALALAPSALGELAGRRDLREGPRQVVLPLPSRRQAGQHDRFLSLPDAEHGGGEAFSRQGAQGLKDWEQPEVINTDKAPTYTAALAELKAKGKCPKDTQHRQIKYLNNIVEADHGKLKQLIRPVRGFKSMKTAYATIKGFEVMRALRKGQAAIFNLTRDIVGEARPVERAFGLGSCALTEAVQLVGERLAAA